MSNNIIVALVLSTFFLGCAENIEHVNNGQENNETENNLNNNEDKKTSRVKSTEEDGITTTKVDASSEEEWVYLSFKTGAEVTVEKAEVNDEWDLGFQRFKIKSNGGISGGGAVEIAVLPAANFDDLTQAPSSGYLSDEADSNDDDQDPDFVFLAEAWYAYDPTDHTLTANDIVYVVHSVDGDYYKVQFLSYYDDAGTPAFPTFRWGKIAAPDTDQVDGIEVDASTNDEWTYVDVVKGQVVNVSDPSATIWDIAFSKTQIRTNSGTTAEGLAGAKTSDETNWDAITSSSTIGFYIDENLPLPGPPGSGEFSGNLVLNGWYDYDAETHVVSPKEDLIFIVRSTNGEYASLRIKKYEDGIYLIETKAIEKRVDVFTFVLDAKAETVYLSFRTGELINPTELATDTNWDLALSNTQIQTNSGTSGPGKGGASEVAVTTLEAITSVPGNACYLPAEGHICDCDLTVDACADRSGIWTDLCEMCPTGFEIDASLPVPGPPESGEFSGNPILNTWYDYDSDTHIISAKDTAYVVKTADEGFAKIKIKNYDDGTMTIDWAFAGAGQRDF